MAMLALISHSFCWYFPCVLFCSRWPSKTQKCFSVYLTLSQNLHETECPEMSTLKCLCWYSLCLFYVSPNFQVMSFLQIFMIWILAKDQSAIKIWIIPSGKWEQATSTLFKFKTNQSSANMQPELNVMLTILSLSLSFITSNMNS